MATYKVLQDIEAEDKLVGPLTLRQFIYAAVTAICLYISFLLVTKGAPFLLVIFVPPALVSGFFAFPWGREQPTEIWALAKLRFMVKPRKRIWNQSGVKEMVTVTAPKKVEPIYTNGLSQTEVSSRLHALADTIDSRGWAIKNVQTGRPITTPIVGQNPADSDRLVGVNILPEVQPIADVAAADDMLDEQNSPIARQFDQMIKQSNAEHHERIMQEISQAQAAPPTPAPASSTAAPADYWFLNQGPTVGNAQTIRPGATVPPSIAGARASAEEAALSEQLKEQSKESIQISYGHLRTIQPLSEQHQMTRPVPTPEARPAAPTPAASSPVSAPAPEPTKTTTPPVTHQPNPATLKYVNNDDLTVATIARQVNENPPDEIVISLH